VGTYLSKNWWKWVKSGGVAILSWHCTICRLFCELFSTIARCTLRLIPPIFFGNCDQGGPIFMQFCSQINFSLDQDLHTIGMKWEGLQWEMAPPLHSTEENQWKSKARVLPKPRIKSRIVHHRACDQIVQALSPFFVHYATKSWGGAWERG